MSWGRINHPSEMVAIDQEIEVQILHIDHEKEKIALGLKQKIGQPVGERRARSIPVGSRIKGTVVNVMSYGAFVKLEEGIEGLVHISEMSWTKRISHPSELVQIDDEIEVVVLGINKDKQEISLGMKQTQENPWDQVADRYPPGSDRQGHGPQPDQLRRLHRDRRRIDGLLHVSDMSWTRKISHPNEMVEKGQELECRVLSVDQDRRRIALGLKQLTDDPWATDIPGKYQPGQIVKGTVTKITNFGVFVGLENGLEGLLHISELADHKVENPEDVVKVGEEIEVKVLRVDADERKIGLSRKRVEWAEEAEAEAAALRPVMRPAVDDKRAEGRRGRRHRSADPADAADGQGFGEESRAAAEEQSAESPETADEPAQAEPPANRDGRRGRAIRRGTATSTRPPQRLPARSFCSLPSPRRTCTVCGASFFSASSEPRRHSPQFVASHASLQKLPQARVDSCVVTDPQLPR